MNRVVVTGMGAITSLGADWPTFQRNLINGNSAVRYMSDWDIYTDLNTRLAAPVLDFEKPAHWTRKQVRSMGRVAMMAIGSSHRHPADQMSIWRSV